MHVLCNFAKVRIKLCVYYVYFLLCSLVSAMHLIISPPLLSLHAFNVSSLVSLTMHPPTPPSLPPLSSWPLPPQAAWFILTPVYKLRSPGDPVSWTFIITLSTHQFYILQLSGFPVESCGWNKYSPMPKLCRGICVDFKEDVCTGICGGGDFCGPRECC